MIYFVTAIKNKKGAVEGYRFITDSAMSVPYCKYDSRRGGYVKRNIAEINQRMQNGILETAQVGAGATVDLTYGEVDAIFKMYNMNKFPVYNENNAVATLFYKHGGANDVPLPMIKIEGNLVCPAYAVDSDKANLFNRAR